MSGISTHVLDVSRGVPAPGIKVSLSRLGPGGQWSPAGEGTTDADGRVASLLRGGDLERGEFRLRFETGAYFASAGVESFYPFVEIVFGVGDAARHYHVPLLLSPFGYTTYRGS